MTAGIEFDPAERDAIAAEMNISVLKRTDTAIKCVLKSANHVCLYQLEDNHQWRRLDVEGSLFIVERHLDHRNNPDRCMHRIVIINRKSLDNYTDDIIVGNKHLELSDQMIMYSNSKRATIGIWFYQKAQADEIFDFLQRIVKGEDLQPSQEPPRSKRTPRRPSKPVDQPPVVKSSDQLASATEPGPQNSLERFFPNLKLTNGVAGQQVPESAKDTMFESQAVSTMSKSPGIPKAATAFKPTSDIDAAIIVASEIGIPEGAVTGTTATDANTLASQALQVVQGKPKLGQKQKSGARPRSTPKSTSPQNSSRSLNFRQPARPNGVGKTISPSRAGPPTKGSVPGKGSMGAKVNPASRQQKQILKASPTSKRVPVGKHGEAVKGSSSVKPRVEDRSHMTSYRTATPTANGAGKVETVTTPVPNPQIQLLQRPKSAAEPKPADVNKQPKRSYLAASSLQASREMAATTSSSSQHAGDVIMNETGPQLTVQPGKLEGPITPNAPIEKKVPWAPLAGAAQERRSSSANARATTEDEGGAMRLPNMVGPGADEEARRQLHNFTLQQAAHAEKLKMQEAHMYAMQQGFPFASGDLGLVPPSSMLGGGVAGHGAGGAAFAPSLHPQMAMMMQQQQHQMFLQQQFLAQQRQRQMQLQAEHAKTLAEVNGNGIGKETEGSGAQSGQSKTMEESANDLMRMLNVDRGESKREVARLGEKLSAKGVGESMAMAESIGQLGTSGDKLDKASFRAVVQRMLTDRKLFEGVYGDYLRSRGE